MWAKKLEKKRYYLLFTLFFISFGIIIALLVSLINFQTHQKDIENQLKKISQFGIESKRYYLDLYVSKTHMLLDSIVDNELTTKYIQSQTNENKRNINNLFSALAQSNKDIMQLRYINEDGKEVIRVDRTKTSSELVIIPHNKLQNKSSRYYYKESAKLSKNEYWHSNLDLNIENGQIERPLNPTFRIATPLYIDNTYKGIVIVNLLFKQTIEMLSHSKVFNVYLSDKDGEIIHSYDHVDSWSKYLKTNKNMFQLFPKQIKYILANDEFQGDGIYSYSLADSFQNNEGIKIIFKTKDDAMKNLVSENWETTYLIALSILFVAVPLSWIISIIPSKLQSKLENAYEEIKRESKIIDKYVMITKLDKNGTIIHVSRNFTDITGYSPKEVIGKKYKQLKHNYNDETHQSLLGTLESGKVWENDIKDSDKAGNELWLNLIVSPEFDEKNNITQYTAIAKDITEKKIIEKMSITDSLTNLYNRRKIEEIMSGEIDRFKRYRNNFSIIFIDIDKFKNINDVFGHKVGDEVLIDLSNILLKYSRPTDFVGRWGGEEFIIVTSQTDIKQALLFAELLRQKIENFEFSTKKPVTISSGVTQYNDMDTISSVISRADDALYKAKESGRNKVVEG